jgi:hypothetical protein
MFFELKGRLNVDADDLVEALGGLRLLELGLVGVQERLPDLGMALGVDDLPVDVVVLKLLRKIVILLLVTNFWEKKHFAVCLQLQRKINILAENYADDWFNEQPVIYIKVTVQKRLFYNLGENKKDLTTEHYKIRSQERISLLEK